MSAMIDLKTASKVADALSAGLWEVQWWIEHNREHDYPMVEVGKRAMETRAKLLAAFKDLESIGVPVRAPKEILADAARRANQGKEGQG